MNRKYFQEHVDWLAANIQGTKFKDLTDMFNERFGMDLSVPAMVSMTAARGLHNGITVVPEFIEKGKATRFQKGQVPPNKGVKGIHLSPATEFKKGNVPANHRPVGSERVSVDGYTEVKVREPNKWRMKHVVVYEAANGPVPKGHVIIFGDGNKENFAPDNLILVSRGQLAVMNRWGLIKNDADLTRTGIIVADLRTKIWERSKKGGKNKMPKKQKFSDEQLIELLQNPEYTNNKQVIDAIGASSCGALNNRLNQLRKANGLPIAPSRGKKKAEPVDTVECPAGNDRPVDISSPPAEETLNWDDIQPDARLLRLGKPIKVVSIGPAAMTIEDRFGFKGNIDRKYFEENREKFARDKDRAGGIEAEKHNSEDPIKTMEAEQSVESLFGAIDPGKTVVAHCKPGMTTIPAPDNEIEAPKAPTIAPMEAAAVGPDYIDPEWGARACQM